MAASPTFSVIIAVYNGAATLGRAIDSVLRQSYSAMELIVVDDGSNDATPQVVTGYGDQVHYLRQDNAGVSAARNAGAAAARGEWLAFLDADDWYYPHRLRWHAEWIQRDFSLDFLTGNFDYCRPDGTLIRRSMENTEAGRLMLCKAGGMREVVMEGEEFTPFIEQHFGDTHTLSVPRKSFLDLGGYPVGLAVCEDVNFLIRLCAQSCRVGVICEPMASYCNHDPSATRSDPLRAQQLTLRALLPLTMQLASAPGPVRAGLGGAIRHARLDLAQVLLRQGRGGEALKVVLPLLVTRFGWRSVRDVLSILRGLISGG